MKRSKRLTSLVLLAALALGLIVGCGKEQPRRTDPGSAQTPVDDGVFTIGYVFPEDSSGLDVSVLSVKRLEKEIEASGAEAKFTQAGDPSASQLDQINTLVAQKVDCLLVLPENINDLSVFVANANAAKIPFVCVGNRSADCTGDYYYVGSEAYEAGYTQGEYAAQKLKDSAKILYLTNNYYQDTIANDRKIGFYDALGDYSRDDVKTLSEKLCESDDQREEAATLVQEWLKTYKVKGSDDYEFDAIIAESGQAALGALDALKAAKLEDRFLLTCIGSSDEILDAVAEGDIAQTVMVDTATQAEQCGKLLAALALGAETDEEHICVHISVTKDNVAEQQDR